MSDVEPHMDLALPMAAKALAALPWRHITDTRKRNPRVTPYTLFIQTICGRASCPVGYAECQEEKQDRRDCYFLNLLNEVNRQDLWQEYEVPCI